MRWLLWKVPVLSCGDSPRGSSFALVSELYEHPTHESQLLQAFRLSNLPQVSLRHAPLPVIVNMLSASTLADSCADASAPGSFVQRSERAELKDASYEEEREG